MASRSALRDYPLEPYLAYDELTHRLKSASNEGGRALPHRTRRPAADRLAETALAAPAGRPRRLEDLRQLLRSEAELHRTRLPVWPVPAGPRPEGRRLRHQRTPVADRQVAAGCLRHPVRPLAGEGQLTGGKGLETPQAGRRSAQLQPRLAPRAAPADPRQPGRAGWSAWRRTPPS